MPTTLDKAQLAIHGGRAVRSTLLPYGRQTIEDDDIAAVAEVLRSDWLTTGPKVSEFERAFADFTGAREAVAVSNGTAALHAATAALRIEPGDEVIVTPLTFAASANCIVYQGGTPVFVDVEPDTLLLDPSLVERAITKRTKAIVAVDYAGHPADYDSLNQLGERHGLAVIGDAAHSLGGELRGRKVGTLAKLTTFSLHPVKLMTTGEGGMITTDDPLLARWMRAFRSHGITSDHRQREAEGSWFYEMNDLGYNYRITDFQCALGLSQLHKLGEWLERRSQIAALYDKTFESMAAIKPLSVKPDVKHGHHLYVVRVVTGKVSATRGEIFSALRAENIGVNVHYVPVHLHPYYRRHYRTAPGLCPVAEAAYEELITLPIFPGMSDEDAADVINAVRKVIDHYSV
jgi:perosamine synthetase